MVLLNLEVVAVGIDLGGGCGAAPGGVGFAVVAGALHGWTFMLYGVAVLDMAEAFVLSMMSKVAQKSEGCMKSLQAPKAGAVIIEVTKGWAAPAVNGCAVRDAPFLINK